MNYFLELAQQYPHDAAAQLADQANEIADLKARLSEAERLLNRFLTTGVLGIPDVVAETQSFLRPADSAPAVARAVSATPCDCAYPTPGKYAQDVCTTCMNTIADSADEALCESCGHSYGQHHKGPVSADYCRHCPCPKWMPTSTVEPTP